MSKPCSCPLAGYCDRHKITKPETWHKLCQTREGYRNLWDKGIGPGQSNISISTPRKNTTIVCPHRTTDNICSLATDIAMVACPTSEETCVACTKSSRPQRLNTYVLTLAMRQNPDINISHIESVIDGTSTGFGTRLANTLGLIIKPESGCGCQGHRDVLDVWTEPYIKENLEKVIDWLQTEATNRRLPFSRILTRLLLKSLLSKS